MNDGCLPAWQIENLLQEKLFQDLSNEWG